MKMERVDRAKGIDLSHGPSGVRADGASTGPQTERSTSAQQEEANKGLAHSIDSIRGPSAAPIRAKMSARTLPLALLQVGLGGIYPARLAASDTWCRVPPASLHPPSPRHRSVRSALAPGWGIRRTRWVDGCCRSERCGKHRPARAWMPRGQGLAVCGREEGADLGI